MEFGGRWWDRWLVLSFIKDEGVRGFLGGLSRELVGVFGGRS